MAGGKTGAMRRSVRSLFRRVIGEVALSVATSDAVGSEGSSRRVRDSARC